MTKSEEIRLKLFARKTTDLNIDREAIRGGRYGMIEVEGGRLGAIYLRPIPKLVSILDVLVSGRLYHRFAAGDRAYLYYNQPRRHPNYLALAYVLSASDCTLATLRAGLAVLDRIAEIKRCDALLCDASNWRISQRLLGRAGWEAHAPSRWHRNYIRRFYGAYPAAKAATPILRGLNQTALEVALPAV